ncbi:MAG: hypothetical protein AAB523_00820 [Patescibacteria group bacterium]
MSLFSQKISVANDSSNQKNPIGILKKTIRVTVGIFIIFILISTVTSFILPLESTDDLAFLMAMVGMAIFLVFILLIAALLFSLGITLFVQKSKPLKQREETLAVNIAQKQLPIEPQEKRRGLRKIGGLLLSISSVILIQLAIYFFLRGEFVGYTRQVFWLLLVSSVILIIFLFWGISLISEKRDALRSIDSWGNLYQKIAGWLIISFVISITLLLFVAI